MATTWNVFLQKQNLFHDKICNYYTDQLAQGVQWIIKALSKKRI